MLCCLEGNNAVIPLHPNSGAHGESVWMGFNYAQAIPTSQGYPTGPSYPQPAQVWEPKNGGTQQKTADSFFCLLPKIESC